MQKTSPSTQKEEDIFVELSRQFKRIRKDFATSKAKLLPDLEIKAKAYVAELQDESLSSLAEYIYKRKLILDVFEDKSGFDGIENVLRLSQDNLLYAGTNVMIEGDPNLDVILSDGMPDMVSDPAGNLIWKIDRPDGQVQVITAKGIAYVQYPVPRCEVPLDL